LTLKSDEPLSKFAFNFNLCRYGVEMPAGGVSPSSPPRVHLAVGAADINRCLDAVLPWIVSYFWMVLLPIAAAVHAHREAGAYTRPIPSSTSALLVSEPYCVQFMTSYGPSIY